MIFSVYFQAIFSLRQATSAGNTFSRFRIDISADNDITTASQPTEASMQTETGCNDSHAAISHDRINISANSQPHSRNTLH